MSAEEVSIAPSSPHCSLLLCPFTSRHLSSSHPSLTFLHPISRCICSSAVGNECEKGVVRENVDRMVWQRVKGWAGENKGGRATVQWEQGEQWGRKRQREKKGERGRVGERTREMVCGCQATIDNQIPKHSACDALPSLQAWITHTYTLLGLRFRFVIYQFNQNLDVVLISKTMTETSIFIWSASAVAFICSINHDSCYSKQHIATNSFW